MLKTLKSFLSCAVVFIALASAFILGNLKKTSNLKISDSKIHNSDSFKSIADEKIEKYISVVNDTAQYKKVKAISELNEKYNLFFDFYNGGDYIGAMHIAEEILINSEPESKDHVKSYIMMLDCEVQLLMFQKELGNEPMLDVEYYSSMKRLLDAIIAKCNDNKYIIMGDEYIDMIYTNAQLYKDYYSKYKYSDK